MKNISTPKWTSMEKTKLITSGKQHSGYHEARETKQRTNQARSF